MSHVAITGGLGFVGSHLADRFASLGWRVTIIDDCRANVVEPSEMTAVAGLELREAAEWAYDVIDQRIDTGGLDLVVHCASPVGPGAVASLGGTIAPEIVGTTLAVASLCEYRGVPLVNISSSEAYGTASGSQPSESAPLCHVGPFSPRAEYGIAKAAAECMVENLGGRSASIRLFNTCGPGQSATKGFVIPTFVEQVKAGEALSVYEPDAVRAFTHVADVCSFITGFWHVITERGGAWNVGNAANRRTIADLAGMVIDQHRAETGESGSWRVVDPVTVWGDRFSFFGPQNGAKVPDASKAKALGWRPVYDIGDVVKAAYRS